jgi:hypothetical protein
VASGWRRLGLFVVTVDIFAVGLGIDDHPHGR